MSTGNTKPASHCKRASDDKQKDCNTKRVKFKHDKSDLSLDYPDSGETSEELGESDSTLSQSAPENDPDYFPSDWTSDSSTTTSRHHPIITRDQQAHGLDTINWPWEDTTYRCTYRKLTTPTVDGEGIRSCTA